MANKFKGSVDFGIIGLGRFGTALANTLAAAGKEVMVIDSHQDKVRHLSGMVEQAYVTDQLDKDTLREAGIGNCETVVICVGGDISVSILTTLNVLELGVQNVISKAASPEHGNVLKKIGAKVVYPEKDMAERLANSLMYSDILERIDLSGSHSIEEIRVPEKFAGKTILETNVRGRYGINIIAFIRDGETIVEFGPKFSFKKNDVFVVIGDNTKLKKFCEDYL